MVHARKTSPGVGSAYFNSNNHPFVSEDRRIGVIHNGKIHEASFLTKKYETQTDCDSEIILRMYESGIVNEKPVDLTNVPTYLQERLPGLQELWSVMREGSCASMIGELHEDGSRSLIVFRNEKRPLWIADLRQSLGQIFFFSSIDIWFKALKEFKHKNIVVNTKIAEIPEEEIWSFKIDQKNPIVNTTNFHRLKVEKNFTSSTNWINPENKTKISNKRMNLSIVTDLDEKGNPPVQKTTTTTTNYTTYNKGTTNAPYNGYASGNNWDSYRSGEITKTTTNTAVKNIEVKNDTKTGVTTIIEKDDPTVHNIPVIESLSEISDMKTETLKVDEEIILKSNIETFDDEDEEQWICCENDSFLEDAICECEAVCTEISQLASDISVQIYNKSCEGTFMLSDFSDIINSLNQVKQDLDGTLRIVNHP